MKTASKSQNGRTIAGASSQPVGGRMMGGAKKSTGLGGAQGGGPYRPAPAQRGAGRGLGGGSSAANKGGGPACIVCNQRVMAGLDAYMKGPGDGPYCLQHYGDMMIPHQMPGTALGGAQCNLVYRYDNETRERARQIAVSVANQFQQQGIGALPSRRVLDAALGRYLQQSVHCKFCDADVVFSPLSSHFGFNVTD